MSTTAVCHYIGLGLAYALGRVRHAIEANAGSADRICRSARPAAPTRYRFPQGSIGHSLGYLGGTFTHRISFESAWLMPLLPMVSMLRTKRSLERCRTQSSCM